MLSGGDADGPGSADVDVHGFEVPVIVENLNAPVFAVADVHVALGVCRDRVHGVELAGQRSSGSPGLDILSVPLKFRHSRIVISIRDENISGCVPSHIRRAVEIVAWSASARGRFPGRTAAFTHGTRPSPFSRGTATGTCRWISARGRKRSGHRGWR